MSETDREFDEVWPARDGRCQIDIPFECREGPWVTDLKTHFVASNEVWGPDYESNENSGSSDRSGGRANRQDRRGKPSPGSRSPNVVQ